MTGQSDVGCTLAERSSLSSSILASSPWLVGLSRDVNLDDALSNSGEGGSDPTAPFLPLSRRVLPLVEGRLADGPTIPRQLTYSLCSPMLLGAQCSDPQHPMP